MLTTDVLIIGSGIAGASAALQLAQNPKRRITIITREPDPHESNTSYAQGGIISRGPGDSADLLVEDILAAGAGAAGAGAAPLSRRMGKAASPADRIFDGGGGASLLLRGASRGTAVNPGDGRVSHRATREFPCERAYFRLIITIGEKEERPCW